MGSPTSKAAVWHIQIQDTAAGLARHWIHKAGSQAKGSWKKENLFLEKRSDPDLCVRKCFPKMHLCGRDTFVAESVSERYIPTKGAVSTVSLWLAKSLRSGCILLPLQGHFALEFDQQPLLSKPVWLKDYYDSFLASSDCYLLVGNPKSKYNFCKDNDVLACSCISQPSFCQKNIFANYDKLKIKQKK